MHGWKKFDWAGVVIVALFGISSASAAAQEVQDRSSSHADLHADIHAHASEPSALADVPLYDDLGDHHRAITTRAPETQTYFDQGLRLQYAFNHAEAIRSYQAALAFDAECAMCWWGLALAEGHNINAPLSDDGGRRAFQAIGRARELTDGLTAVERHLIEALAERYGPDPSTDRLTLDTAYAGAMALVAHTHPDDADVATLYGASLMNLSPWNYWDGPYGKRTAKIGTERIIEVLERALRLAPNNPGACHYYIHSVEAAFPDKAVECADRLAALMPGAGHIVHMPGHIYVRVGRYADAVRQNEHAVHSDESMISDLGMPTLYTGAYYPHNYHFLAFAATMAGMGEKALQAARTVAPKVPVDMARETYWIQNAVVLPQLTLLTFGRWEEVLDQPLPPDELEQASILARYARGVAHAALGATDDAREVLREIRRRAEGVEGHLSTNPIPGLAAETLAGEIALRTGDPETAVAHFQAAADIEDVLLYDEPPLWYYPARHSLGRALLEAGRPAEAEQAYREDLERFPENGWSLFGLTKSLEAQGRLDEAREVRSRFARAWANADVSLTASRF